MSSHDILISLTGLVVFALATCANTMLFIGRIARLERRVSELEDRK